MRVMKFISLAVILVVVSTLAVAQQAPAQTAPTVKHVPINNIPSKWPRKSSASWPPTKYLQVAI